MTGELTLTGRVLPIGGLKEKVLGAVRAGISQIILPIENEADLEDIPEDLRTSLTFHLASTLDDVVKIALADRKKPKKRRASAKRRRSVKNSAATA